MKKLKWLLLAFIISSSFLSSAQTKVDSIKFFTDEDIVEISLSTDIRKLQNEKLPDVFQEAEVTLTLPGSTPIKEAITVGARGHFRREQCNIPPIMMDFKNSTSPLLSPLGKLKLVIACGPKADDEQLVLKEFLVYKIYNLLEDKSFRVRLVKMNYNDTRGKVKPFTQYAFLLEDDKDLATRNGCIKKDKATYNTESTNRSLMTKVAVFEYMISNGDWSVPGNHNIKLIYDKENTNALPFVVPYDFDHSGFVNAGYALPSEILGTEAVTERVYRGFPRSMEELQLTFDLFKAKKDAIMSLINNFTLLKENYRKEATRYLEEFYKTINNKKEVQSIFIDNARTK